MTAGLAAVGSDGVDELAHVFLDGLVDAVQPLQHLGVTFIGGLLPLVDAIGDVLVDRVQVLPHLPLVHATESNAWLVVCLSGRKLVKGAH